jgi:hypothetical protein
MPLHTIDFYDAITDLTNGDTASPRTQGAGGIHIGNLTSLRNRCPCPILRPNGRIIDQLPGQRRECRAGSTPNNKGQKTSSIDFHQIIPTLNSLRSHWNNGKLESWNDGFKETLIQNVYDFIDFLVLMAYFSGKTRKKMLSEHHQ